MTIPGIKIIAPAKSSKKGGDVYLGKKGKYFRISNDIAELLSVKSGDYIVVAKFGSTMLIGKKPKGMFGYRIRDNSSKTKHYTSGLHFHNASTIESEGFLTGNYFLSDVQEVDDRENKVKWYKFKHESEK